MADNHAVRCFSEPFCDELWQLFALRRDVREFRTDTVAPEMLRQVLAAGHAAPSVGLSQPWRFLLVDDRDRRRQVVDEFRRCNQHAAAGYGSARGARYRELKLAGLEDAPVHLLVCAEPEPTKGAGLGRQTQPETVRDSAVCAIQNMWLAARALGLGLGWVSILEPEKLRAILDVPPRWLWVGYLCLGWPVQSAEQPDLELRGWESRSPLDDVILRR